MKERLVLKSRINPETGWYEKVEVKTGSYIFDDADRLSIVREYFETGTSAAKMIEKYHLSSRQVLFGWIDKFLNKEDRLPLSVSTQGPEAMEKERIPAENAEDKPEDKPEDTINRLRKALELEKLRSEAYDVMITEAEKAFNIPIRKKSGTKR